MHSSVVLLLIAQAASQAQPLSVEVIQDRIADRYRDWETYRAQVLMVREERGSMKRREGWCAARSTPPAIKCKTDKHVVFEDDQGFVVHEFDGRTVSGPTDRPFARDYYFLFLDSFSLLGSDLDFEMIELDGDYVEMKARVLAGRVVTFGIDAKTGRVMRAQVEFGQHISSSIFFTQETLNDDLIDSDISEPLIPTTED